MTGKAYIAIAILLAMIVNLGWLTIHAAWNMSIKLVIR